MQPSSQNLPRGGIYSIRKINRKFDFRSACNKIPKTTAFICILTLISGVFYMKSLFFCIPIEFTFSKRNLILQSGIYFFNSPFFLHSDPHAFRGRVLFCRRAIAFQHAYCRPVRLFFRIRARIFRIAVLLLRLSGRFFLLF